MRLEKTTALLALARELAANSDGLTLDEIGDIWRVSRRTAERMRDAVETAFGPLEWVDDGKKRRFRIAARGIGNFATAPTAEELADLEIAAKAHEAAQDSVRAQNLRSLSAKIRASLRDQDRRRLGTDLDAYVRAETFSRQVGPRPFPDAGVFAALRNALLAQRVISFIYQTHESGIRKRTVVPYGLLFGPRYYLVGREANKKKPVLFRLDRISDVEITNEFGSPPETFNLDDYANLSFGVYQEPPEDIELRFAPDYAADANAYLFHPTQKLEKGEDGSITVRFRAGGLLELARELMTWGDGVDVIKPKQLKDILRQEITVLYKHHCVGKKR
jgi:predicted DNA-binding transcriptional regulator YafY